LRFSVSASRRPDLGFVAVGGQQVDEPLVGQAEDGLVVPEGVVGIEADQL
jgi:hypothetical protein